MVSLHEEDDDQKSKHSLELTSKEWVCYCGVKMVMCHLPSSFVTVVRQAGKAGRQAKNKVWDSFFQIQ